MGNIEHQNASGKAFLGMLGVFAEFETNLRRKRQFEGIAKAQKAGVYKGRPLSIDPRSNSVAQIVWQGATEIA